MDEDDDFDSDLEGNDDVDELDLEATISGKRGINWRRVELLRDQRLLMQQLDDYNEYLD